MADFYSRPCWIGYSRYKRICLNADVTNYSYTGAVQDGDQIFIGTNEITAMANISNVLNTATVADGEIYEFHDLPAAEKDRCRSAGKTLSGNLSN